MDIFQDPQWGPFLLGLLGACLLGTALVTVLVWWTGKKRGRSDRDWWLRAGTWSLAAGVLGPLVLLFGASIIFSENGPRWLALYGGIFAFLVLLPSGFLMLFIGLCKPGLAAPPAPPPASSGVLTWLISLCKPATPYQRPPR